MYEIANNWGFPLTLIAFIITLIFGVFPNISMLVRIPLFAFSCIIILAFVISKICTYSYIKVPKIVGCTVAEAKKLLEKNGLKFSPNFIETDEQKIIEQNPKENSYVKKNTPIKAITQKQAVDNVELSLPSNFEFKPLCVTQINSMGDPLNGYFENIVYYDKSIYSGNYKDGIPDGNGIYRAETYEYKGSFGKIKHKDDLFKVVPHGKGKFMMIKEDDGLIVGDSFDGNWIDGNWNGYGVHIRKGDKYEGDFANDKRHGKGKYTYANGNKYEGDWVNGDQHGKGTFIWADGDKYEGDYVKDKRHGKGKYTWANGNEYEGDWINEDQHGKGTFVWGVEDNRSKYEGDWINNNQHGKGTLTWKDGSKYEGDWVDGNRHGKGKLTFGENNEFSGDILEAYYVDDSRNGQGTYYHKNGNYDIGTWENHKKHGTFLCYDCNGQLLREEKYVEDKLKQENQI